MANGLLQLTPEGTGPKTDADVFARGADTIKLPRVQTALGVPLHIASVLNSAAAASKNHAGLFNGQAAGTTPVRVWAAWVVPWLSAAVTGAPIQLTLMRTTAAGAGATGSKTRLRLADAASAGAVTILGTYTTQPTVTAGSNVGAAVVQPEETAQPAERGDLFLAADFLGCPLELAAGDGIVAQQTAIAGAGNVSVFFAYSEL